MNVPQPGWSLHPKLQLLFQMIHMAVADIQYEIPDEAPSFQVSQKILRIVLGLEVPRLPFAMLMTELAHEFPDKT
jgi:hypothetical protein